MNIKVVLTSVLNNNYLKLTPLHTSVFLPPLRYL